MPDAQLKQLRKESLDVAVHAAIARAVIELVGRFPSFIVAR